MSRVQDLLSFLLENGHQFLHRGSTFLKSRLLGGIELHFVNLLDALLAELHGHAHEEALNAVLAFQGTAQGRTFFLSLRMDSTISTVDAAGA